MMKKLSVYLTIALSTLLVFSTHAEPPAIEKGKVLPAFSITDASGESFGYPDDLDAPVIILYWASWCPYCKALMPHLQSIVDEYQGEIEVLALNFRDDEDPVEFMSRYGYDFRLFPNADDVAAGWGVRATPALFLFDGAGRLVFSNYTLTDDDYPSDPADEGRELKHFEKAARRAPFWAALLRLEIDRLQD